MREKKIKIESQEEMLIFPFSFNIFSNKVIPFRKLANFRNAKRDGTFFLSQDLKRPRFWTLSSTLQQKKFFLRMSGILLIDFLKKRNPFKIAINYHLT